MAEMSQIILSSKDLRKPKNVEVEKGKPVSSSPGERITAIGSPLIRNERIHQKQKLCNYVICSKKMAEVYPDFHTKVNQPWGMYP